jgi:hypothetical protein
MYGSSLKFESVTARASKLQPMAGLRLFRQRASRLAFPARAKNGRFGVDSVSARLLVGRRHLTQPDFQYAPCFIRI